MPFLPDLIDKLKGLFAIIVEFLKGLPEKLFSPSNRRTVLIGLGGFLVILLLGIIIGLVDANRSNRTRTDPEPVSSFQRIAIPPEELFLPEEPDFISGVLLEREPRKAWTAGDAEPYWQDPLKNGEEQWRDRIELEIDALLERVP
jgi:hypothetical protein